MQHKKDAAETVVVKRSVASYMIENLKNFTFDDKGTLKPWEHWQLFRIMMRFGQLGGYDNQVDMFRQAANPEFLSLPRARTAYAKALIEQGRSCEAVLVLEKLQYEVGARDQVRAQQRDSAGRVYG